MVLGSNVDYYTNVPIAVRLLLIQRCLYILDGAFQMAWLPSMPQSFFYIGFATNSGPMAVGSETEKLAPSHIAKPCFLSK